MLGCETLYDFVEGSYDYLLAVDGDEQIIHVSRLLKRDCCPEESSLENKFLKDVLTPSSLNTFKSAMAQVRARGRGIAVYAPMANDSCSIPLKAGYARFDNSDIYLFFGSRLEGLSKLDGWEKDERVKQLACLYEVAELIEVSGSINEFFTKLPGCLSPGMLYPEEIVVYSVYQGVEYGQKLASDNY
ncbi:MAG: hypothetical protein KAX38_07380, partial [Candidatus Krumholzibacteria bacterium]|nr:hypothetical protein [Candidatus Krumholzibacteria bacterium]